MGHLICTAYYFWDTTQLDSFVTSAPNQYIFEITSHFQGLYPVIIIGSLVFHLLYGILLGFLAGRMTEVRAFVNRKIGSW